LEVVRYELFNVNQTIFTLRAKQPAKSALPTLKSKVFFFSLAQQLNAGQGRLILEVFEPTQ
jgi:hypothetical protein